MTDEPLLYVHAHAGTVTLAETAHVIVDGDAMTVEVHDCRGGYRMIFGALSRMTCVGCRECGKEHTWIPGPLVIDAAELQGLRIDYL